MKPLRDWFKVSIWFLSVAVILLLALPILFALAFVSRFVFVAGAALALILAVTAYALSPRFRAWTHDVVEGESVFSGLRLATDVAVHPGHAWARVEPESSLVGCDDLLQAALGPVERIDLPAPGTEVGRGERLFRVWHGRRKVDVTSPLTGAVLSANPAVIDHPVVMNEDPYGSGWVLRMRCERPRAQRRSLMRGLRARTWFRQEVDRLFSEVLADRDLAAALPDGGTLDRLNRHIDDAAWERMTRTFFRQGTTAEAA